MNKLNDDRLYFELIPKKDVFLPPEIFDMLDNVMHEIFLYKKSYLGRPSGYHKVDLMNLMTLRESIKNLMFNDEIDNMIVYAFKKRQLEND